MDAIPAVKRQEIERNIRRENGFIQRRMLRAVDLEKHINKVRGVMIKHSNPPFQRPPRTGKLPRSYLHPLKTKPDTVSTATTTSTFKDKMIRPTITEKDFELFMQESPTEKDFYLG